MAEPAATADPELWARRLAAVASLVPADAIAVLLPSGEDFSQLAAHGVRAGADLSALAPLAATAVRERTTARRAALAIPLRDGRHGEAAMVAPLLSGGRTVGALAAVRASAPFTGDDAAVLDRLAPLVALELAESAGGTAHVDGRAVRDEDRRAALALYEVAKAIALAPDAVTGAEGAGAVLADALRSDIIGIFDHEPDGTLRSLAWRGLDPRALPARSDADTALMRATIERRTQRAHPPPGAAWAGGADEVVLAPIASDGRVSGLLLVGRRGRGYTDGEIALASAIAESFAYLRRDRPAPLVRHHDQSVVERRPAPVVLPDPATFLASAPRSSLEPPREERAIPWPLLGLAAGLAAALVATAVLGHGGPLLYALAAAVALAALWAALGSGLGQQFLLLATLAAFVERASAPVIAGTTGAEAILVAAVPALMALATAGVCASRLRRAR